MSVKKNAKQILMTSIHELQDGDEVTVIINRHNDNDTTAIYVETTERTITDKLGVLESAKYIVWEDS